MNTHAHGWRECQPEEQERREELSRVDDELQRGGNALATLAFLVISAMVILMMLFVAVRVAQYRAEHVPIADVYQIHG